MRISGIGFQGEELRYLPLHCKAATGPLEAWYVSPGFWRYSEMGSDSRMRNLTGWGGWL